MELPKPTIEELVSRYTLEPELDDVFVEGTFDKSILEFRARFQRNRRISIYEIDSVDVPSEVVAKYGLTDGNKQRIIALSHELAAETGNCRYRCVVDKDMDEWLGQIRRVERLRYTNYCDTEGYYLASPVLKELVVTVAKAKISNWEKFINSLVKTLNFLYVVRLCAARRSWCIKWVEIRDSLSLINSEVIVDEDAYILKILNKNKLAKQLADFKSEVELAKGEVRERPYQAVRGHDLVEALAKCILELKGVREVASAVAVERILVAMAGEVTELDSLFL